MTEQSKDSWPPGVSQGLQLPASVLPVGSRDFQPRSTMHSLCGQPDVELVREEGDTSAWGAGCPPDSECPLGRLGCSSLASVGVLHTLGAHVGKPSWEEAAEDRAGIELLGNSYSCPVCLGVSWVFLGLVASRYIVGFITEPS